MPGTLIFFFEVFFRVVDFRDARFPVLTEEGVEMCTVEDADFLKAAGLDDLLPIFGNLIFQLTGFA